MNTGPVTDACGLLQPVQCDIQQQGRNHAPNAKGNFCFEVTLGYRRVERGRVSAAAPAGPLESDPGGFVPEEERSAILAGVLDGVELLGRGTGRSPGGWPGWTRRRR